MRSILGRPTRRRPDHPRPPRARDRPTPRGSLAAYETQRLVRSLSPSEWAAVLDLLGDEIARGWVPKRPDIEAAMGVLQIPVRTRALEGDGRR
ncbi:hypothetical protein [Nocardioides lijunqiniae]|uniref:hypothetical protein n=1 Tax=Nocardioides lijunqiniae TaxID=2760832 RepID=UPI0018783D83|nr:hypothetical protein [Nocardioides lijunqiniae]